MQYAPEKDTAPEVRKNPHNQYLFTWAEQGLLGLTALLSMFMVMIYCFARQNNFEGKLGVGLILSFMIGCLANSWLFDFATAFMLVLFVAALRTRPSA